MASADNPRWANGALRRKYRERFKAMGLPCAICGKPIHYDEPSDSSHPWSMVIDERIPISKYKLGGYNSPRECAEDWNNLSCVHYRCNQLKGNKINFKLSDAQPSGQAIHKPIILDGKW